MQLDVAQPPPVHTAGRQLMSCYLRQLGVTCRAQMMAPCRRRAMLMQLGAAQLTTAHVAGHQLMSLCRRLIAMTSLAQMMMAPCCRRALLMQLGAAQLTTAHIAGHLLMSLCSGPIAARDFSRPDNDASPRKEAAEAVRRGVAHDRAYRESADVAPPR